MRRREGRAIRPGRFQPPTLRGRNPDGGRAVAPLTGLVPPVAGAAGPGRRPAVAAIGWTRPGPGRPASHHHRRPGHHQQPGQRRHLRTGRDHRNIRNLQRGRDRHRRTSGAPGGGRAQALGPVFRRRRRHPHLRLHGQEGGRRPGRRQHPQERREYRRWNHRGRRRQRGAPEAPGPGRPGRPPGGRLPGGTRRAGAGTHADPGAGARQQRAPVR